MSLSFASLTRRLTSSAKRNDKRHSFGTLPRANNTGFNSKMHSNPGSMTTLDKIPGLKASLNKYD